VLATGHLFVDKERRVSWIDRKYPAMPKTFHITLRGKWVGVLKYGSLKYLTIGLKIAISTQNSKKYFSSSLNYEMDITS
jgi:hypothetical protein